MFVKPKAGLLVRHPKTKFHIAPEGIEVPDGDTFWVKRIRAGDVEVIDALPSSSSRSVAPHSDESSSDKH